MAEPFDLLKYHGTKTITLYLHTHAYISTAESYMQNSNTVHGTNSSFSWDVLVTHMNIKPHVP